MSKGKTHRFSLADLPTATISRLPRPRKEAFAQGIFTRKARTYRGIINIFLSAFAQGTFGTSLNVTHGASCYTGAERTQTNRPYL